MRPKVRDVRVIAGHNYANGCRVRVVTPGKHRIRVVADVNDLKTTVGSVRHVGVVPGHPHVIRIVRGIIAPDGTPDGSRSLTSIT